jgi:hypothetical protein
MNLDNEKEEILGFRTKDYRNGRIQYPRARLIIGVCSILGTNNLRPDVDKAKYCNAMHKLREAKKEKKITEMRKRCQN